MITVSEYCVRKPDYRGYCRDIDSLDDIGSICTAGYYYAKNLVLGACSDSFSRAAHCLPIPARRNEKKKVREIEKGSVQITPE
jgi:hypothetical protein